MMRNTAAAVFISTTAAIKFRPYTDGRTPWYKTADRPDPTPFPHDYFVPDFGEDRDIKLSKINLAKAEAEVGVKMQASFAPPPSHPVDYFVPDFGVDSDIKLTHNSIKSSEDELGHTMHASFAAAPGHPVDYFVPNFGVDKDIIATQKHIRDTENRLNATMTASFDPPAAIPDNRIPDLGLDADIKTTHRNLAKAEEDLGHNWNLLQLNSELESDPICSSAGCTQYLHPKGPDDHPMDYFVPDFGKSKEEVIATEESLAAAEA